MATLGPEHEEHLESRFSSYRALVAAEQALSMLLLAALFTLIIVQVTARYVFNAPISGTEEVARFTFIWFTFAAASFVAARRKHIVVQLFGGGKTGKVVAGAEIFAYLVMIGVSLAMVVGGLHMVQSTWNITSPGAQVPFPLVYSALPVGFALIALHASLNLLVALRHPEQFAGRPEIETAGL